MPACRPSATETARLQRITARLGQLEPPDEDDARLDVVLKRSEPLSLLGLRRRVLGQREIGPFAVSVDQRLTDEGLWPLSPLVHLYFEVDPDTEVIDLFVGATVSSVPRDESAWLRICLPAGEWLACVIYRGDYPRIGAAYAALGRWLLASGYKSTGPGREVYHRSPLHTSDPAAYVTEIHFPVAPSQSPAQPAAASLQPAVLTDPLPQRCAP